MQEELNVQHYKLKKLLVEIETIRIKRQQEYSNPQTHPLIKRFTQQELNDVAYTTYKNLLVGRSSRMPNRQALINIADYLECTNVERNDLLITAAYLPVQNHLGEQTHDFALDQAREIMNTIPFPGMIVNYDLEVKAMNRPFHYLFDIPLDININSKINMVDLHFNQELPIRSRSAFDTISYHQWELHAISGIQAFKINNMLFHNDDWYQSLTQDFRQNYDVNKYWKMSTKDLDNKAIKTRQILANTGTSRGLFPIRYREIHIAVSNRKYPEIVVYLPVDASARQAFEHIGCPTDCLSPNNN
ncbi:hypothetical protein SAMN04487943_101253 [Gracilibacillus orientalis]|uniref:MmyB-like transcription regulator ligand binding domain-containing protein n=1 Tax=Gracilibacillus orientalis TaxID=334253 RepID=A0A1I4H7U6_9BACI|nr:hypothetical protein [Gracilibacillus orientalis]SFL37840.1 hypothetical protein SAMN04487943_101253 [Gracilibacillus orientalis]